MSAPQLPKGTVFFSGHGQAGNWSDAANWTGGVVPTAAAGNALFTSNATLNNTFTTYRMMMLGTEAITVNGTLNTLTNGPCTSFMDCNGAVVTFTPTSTMNDAGGLIVGVHAQGTFIAQSNATTHATINSRDLKVGQHQGSNGTVVVDGAVWNNSERAFIGMSGVGAMTVSHGGHVNVGFSFGLGVNLGGSGYLTLTDSSHMTVGTYANVGGNNLDIDTPAPAGTGVGTGTLAVNSGSVFSVAQRLMVAAGSVLTLSGGTVNVGNATPGLTVAAGATLSGNGTVSVSSTSPNTVGINNAGLLKATGGTLVINTSIAGTGQVQIADNSTLAIIGKAISVPTIAFTGSNGTLALAHGVVDHASLTGFAAGDSIVMAGVDHFSFNASTDMLTLSSGSTLVDTLHLAGTYASNAFVLTQTSAGAVIGFASVHTASIGH